jgi:galactokinase
VDYLGGVVLPAAVARFTEVSGHRAAEWSIESSVPGGLSYVRAIGDELGARPHAVQVHSEVPPSAGISSSAALLVAVAVGLQPHMDGREAALACQRAEQKATGVQVGVMDQFASALGRRGEALFLDCATLDYEMVPFPDEVAIEVVDSGEHRSLASTPYNQRRREAESGNPKRMRHVRSEIARVHAFVTALRERDFVLMGRLLHESHQSLRDDF